MCSSDLLPGFPVRGRGRYATGMRRTEIAAWLASVGIEGVTAKSLENSRARDPDPTGSVTILTPSDLLLMERLQPVLSQQAIESLLADGATVEPGPEPKSQTITLIPSPPPERPENAVQAETAISSV